jgi:hypothetical protein
VTVAADYNALPGLLLACGSGSADVGKGQRGIAKHLGFRKASLGTWHRFPPKADGCGMANTADAELMNPCLRSLKQSEAFWKAVVSK